MLSLKTYYYYYYHHHHHPNHHHHHPTPPPPSTSARFRAMAPPRCRGSETTEFIQGGDPSPMPNPQPGGSGYLPGTSLKT